MCGGLLLVVGDFGELLTFLWCLTGFGLLASVFLVIVSGVIIVLSLFYLVATLFNLIELRF